jgi:hypothetical protein
MGILWLAGCGAIINALGSDDDPATTAQPTPAAAQATNAPPVDETTEPEPEPEPWQGCVEAGNDLGQLRHHALDLAGLLVNQRHQTKKRMNCVYFSAEMTLQWGPIVAS